MMGEERQPRAAGPAVVPERPTLPQFDPGPASRRRPAPQWSPVVVSRRAWREQRPGAKPTAEEVSVHKKLSPHQVKEMLEGLPHWRLETAREAIVREFVFADFKQAFAFMTEVALAAEKRDHHPEWANIYSRVNIVLTSHDAGGLTAQDAELARCADEAYNRYALVPGAR